MIVCITPDDGIAETFSRVAKEFKEKIVVERGLLEAAVPIARRWEDEADVIVSRGGTVLVMRSTGDNIANLIAYNKTKRVSKHPETFGHSEPQGLVAAEVLNNKEKVRCILI